MAKSTDELIDDAQKLKQKITDGSELKSSRAVKKVSQDYLDELIRELNQIKDGQAFGSDEEAAKKSRKKEIEREIKLVMAANGIETGQQFNSWWQAAKHYGGNAVLLGVAVAVGVAVAALNPVGLPIVLGVVAALAVFGICKGVCALWNWFRGNNSDAKMRSAAQQELGLDKAAKQELASGRGIELTPVSSTQSASVPNPAGSQMGTQSPGAQAAQQRRLGK